MNRTRCTPQIEYLEMKPQMRASRLMIYFNIACIIYIRVTACINDRLVECRKCVLYSILGLSLLAKVI